MRSRFGWEDKTVVITGGTGTFGQAFTRYLLETEHIAAVRILSRDEMKQWEMSQRVPDQRLRFFIGDVRDRDRLRRAFSGADVVVHAAALKQVPSCEYNPFEAVKTNIIGAENVIDAAIESGVERIVGLSTDKAANPVNLYGATKLCAEKLFVQGNSYAGSGQTAFACVRYGNVVGSRGSVIPLFMEQRTRGVLTITDRRMTRFWITVRQAVDFVKRSVETLHGGEIFVPKLPTVLIADVAKIVAPDADTREIGIRPGEKLHEVLITSEESRRTLDLGDQFFIEPEHAWWTSDRPHGGNRIAAESAYSSDRNEWVLSRDEIANALPGALAEARQYEASTGPQAEGAEG